MTLGLSKRKDASPKRSPERMRICGRGGAGNMHTPSEIRTLDAEESAATAQLAHLTTTETTSAVKINNTRRRSSIFSSSSSSKPSSVSSSLKSSNSFLGLAKMWPLTPTSSRREKKEETNGEEEKSDETASKRAGSESGVVIGDRE